MLAASRTASFRKGLDPIELHWQVSALCFFNVSNRATFSKIFGSDIGTPKALASLRRNAVDMVLRYVVKAEAPAGRTSRHRSESGERSRSRMN